MRRRGQAIAEFAMVFPVFMVCVFTFVFLSIWSYNTSAASNVAREAARAASLQASKSSQYFATHPITLITFPDSICGPYGGPRLRPNNPSNWIGATVVRPSGGAYLIDEISGFRSRNRLVGCNAGRETPPSETEPRSRYLYAERLSGGFPYERLGWDWGLLTENRAGEYSIAPLRAAIAEAKRLLEQRVLGGGDGALISACYRLSLADGQLSECVMTLVDGAAQPTRAGALAATSWLTSAPAPSAVSVSISLPTIGIAFLPPYIERGGATLLLDRLSIPCRAPLTATDVFPGSCGSLY